MIVLLEGADCSGKTTLAEAFAVHLRNKCVYLHNGPKENTLKHYMQQLDQAKLLSAQGKVVVIDRQWISEQIYGIICRQETLDPEGRALTLNHYNFVYTIMCVRLDLAKHQAQFHSSTREEYERVKFDSIALAYHDLWYGRFDSEFPGIVGTLTRRMPLRYCRSFSQYDMDTRKPLHFADSFISRHA